MRRDYSRTKSLLEEFSKKREIVKRDEPSGFKKKRDLRPKTKKQNSNYLDKIKTGRIEELSSKDIMSFFKDTARDSGVKYIDSKPIVSMRNVNLAIERGYTKEELLVMIEFLYTSEQDYLDKRTLHIGILLTQWNSKIYADSQDWLNDEYKTDNQKKHVREWNDEIPEEDNAEIGEWNI